MLIDNIAGAVEKGLEGNIVQHLMGNDDKRTTLLHPRFERSHEQVIQVLEVMAHRPKEQLLVILEVGAVEMELRKLKTQSLQRRSHRAEFSNVVEEMKPVTSDYEHANPVSNAVVLNQHLLFGQHLPDGIEGKRRHRLQGNPTFSLRTGFTKQRDHLALTTSNLFLNRLICGQGAHGRADLRQPAVESIQILPKFQNGALSCIERI